METNRRNMGQIEKLLSQKELAEIYRLQKSGDYSLLQKNQLNLRGFLVDTYEKNWQKFSTENPDIKPIFDLKNPKSHEVKITKEIADKYNLLSHLKEFDQRSENSTAGIRAFYDILHSENPSMMYNDVFLALLIDAEAEFLSQIQIEIGGRIKKIEDDDPGFVELISNLEKYWGKEKISIVEAIFEMKIPEIIKFLKNNAVKLVGGEVRAHTEKFVGMEARILAEKGVMVITAEKFTDSVPIFMHSFLTFILGVTGTTNYTPSHSPNYLFGRKVIAFGGGQLLPDKYENYRRILRNNIENKIIGGDGHIIKLSSDDNPNIKRSLTYERMVKLYSSILNITLEDIEKINQATNVGHRIKLNCLNGSTWKTFGPLLDELKINKDVFDLVYENEDPFFETGYVVTQQKDEKGYISYNVDHLGTDVSMSRVATTVPYSFFLQGEPVGRKVYECDADSDRFCVKQIVENSEENLKLISDFSLDYYKLDDNKVLVALSPNKSFLLLDIADYERMKSAGTWDEYWSLYIITYVSTKAWPEFAAQVSGMVKLMTRVGFKNLTEIQQTVESWYYTQKDKEKISFEDQLGLPVEIDRSRKLRIHCKEEESGGRVAGTSRDCRSILGDIILAMPEKSDPDSVLSELVLSSTLFLENRNAMTGNYRYLEMLRSAFEKYQLISKVDVRLDIMHGDQGSIAMMPYKQQQEALEMASEAKANFNNFFFSIGKAVRDEKMTIEEVSEIMTRVLPDFKSTWRCIDSITLSEEPLAGGRTRPEGVPMTFKKIGDNIPLITEFDFRPSGTDPLKSKIYIDAENLKASDRKLIEDQFNNLTKYDLFAILDEFKIISISPRLNIADKLEKIS